MTIQPDLRSDEVIDWAELDPEVNRPQKKKKNEKSSSDIIRVIPQGSYVISSPLRKGRIKPAVRKNS